MPESGADTWQGRQSQASLPGMERIFMRFIGHSSQVALGSNNAGKAR